MKDPASTQNPSNNPPVTTPIKKQKRSVTITNPQFSGTLVPWNRLTKTQRHREIIRFVDRYFSFAVTINLHPRFEALLCGKAKPMREVSKRMNDRLRQIDQHRLPVMLVLEATREEGRLHLHGLFLGPAELKEPVGKAMRDAVGHIPGRSGSRQFMAKSGGDRQAHGAGIANSRSEYWGGTAGSSVAGPA